MSSVSFRHTLLRDLLSPSFVIRVHYGYVVGNENVTETKNTRLLWKHVAILLISAVRFGSHSILYIYIIRIICILLYDRTNGILIITVFAVQNSLSTAWFRGRMFLNPFSPNSSSWGNHWKWIAAVRKRVHTHASLFLR